MRIEYDRSAATFPPAVSGHLLNLAQDTVWLLQNGNALSCLERTSELYDNWLRVKLFRSYSGKTSLSRLASDMCDLYGSDFLELFDAYNSGACAWIKYHLFNTKKLSIPINHLLLIRLLAGNPEKFFAGSNERVPEYRPYGEPPYPCRNHLCDYHLQDVIDKVEIKIAYNTPYGTFSCPYCGFAYRRKGNLEKGKQYETGARTVNYGWVWEEFVVKLLKEGKSVNYIGRQVHCGGATILAFAVKNGLIDIEQNNSLPKTHTTTMQQPAQQKSVNFAEQRDYYRSRWMSLRAENPTALRNALVLLDSMCCKWLRNNDKDWFEQNSPPKFYNKANWEEQDNEYAERVIIAMNQIRDAPGRPKQLSVKAIGKVSGISALRKKIAAGRLPKTRALLSSNVETHRQWQYRKIQWAVKQMLENGASLTISGVLKFASIGYKQGPCLSDYIIECIANNK
jgi:hypothetical protein